MTFDLPGQIKNLLPGPLDALRGPYADVSSALSAIPSVIVGGKNYREGKVVDIGTAPDTVEYTWQGSFEDASLKPKKTSTTTVITATFSNNSNFQI